MKLSFNTHIDKLSYLNTFYLEVPAAIVEKAGGLASKVRLWCEVNNTLRFQCGFMALGEGKAYISMSSKRMKEIGVGYGDNVSVILTEDKSEYGVEFPVELSELFKQDSEGKERFDNLTPGKQRYVLNYISTVKSSPLRIERALLLITNLKTLPRGKENFREMLGK